MSIASELIGVRKRRAPMIYQAEQAECGLACLAMISGYHGKHLEVYEIRQRFQVSSKGATVDGLVRAAKRLDLVARVLKVGLSALPKLQLPAVVHWDLSHFVVLVGRKGGRYLVHDPARGAYWLEAEELSGHFSGICLELTPNPDFTPQRRSPSLTFGDLFKGLTGVRPLFIELALLSLLLQAVVLATPFVIRLILDDAGSRGDPDFVLMVGGLLAATALLAVGVTALRHKAILYLSNQFSYHVAVRIFAHMSELPVSYFQNRSYGDVVTRYRAIEPIRDLVTRDFLPAVLDGILAIVSLVALFALSPLLAGICAALLLAVLLYHLAVLGTSRERQEARTQARSDDISRVLEIVRGILTIKSFGKEDHVRAHWQALHARFINANVAVERLTGQLDTVSAAARFGQTAVVAVLGGVMVAQGSLTIGSLVAFYLLSLAFIDRGLSLCKQVFSFKNMSVNLAQLADITTATPERGRGGFPLPPDAAGEIRLENVSFRYSESEPWILSDVNLVVPAGAHVAIAGPSGGGKTTLLKVALGLLEPTQGTVRLDGVKLGDIDRDDLRAFIGAVQQNDTLFAGTIAENIAFFDAIIDWERVEDCARKAYIHDEIVAFPMRYHTLAGDLQSTVSGGQKQRICLARALYHRPRILGIDEGTSHLDMRAEEEVNRALEALPVTRITIAHRRETLRSADRVYHLAGGRLTDPAEAGADLRPAAE